MSYINRRKANKYINFLTRNIPNEVNKTVAGVSGGAGLLSLYDLYEVYDNHEEVLDALGSEWKHILGSDPSLFKTYSLFNKKALSQNDLINLKAKLAGHYGENEAINYLRTEYDGEMTFENANRLAQ